MEGQYSTDNNLKLILVQRGMIIYLLSRYTHEDSTSQVDKSVDVVRNTPATSEELPQRYVIEKSISLRYADDGELLFSIRWHGYKERTWEPIAY